MVFPRGSEEPSAGAQLLVKGASQPWYQIDAESEHDSHTPAPRRISKAPAERAETLSLPPGLHGQPPPRETLPRTVIDARIAFIHWSRELGREYKTRYAVTLSTDISGVQEMQRHLRSRFPHRTVTTDDDALEVRRHGAFLSEVFARSFGAHWVDIGPSEIGYWAMQIPPALRVWPFGRILRFITMAEDNDLVEYYAEIADRVR